MNALRLRRDALVLLLGLLAVAAAWRGGFTLPVAVLFAVPSPVLLARRSAYAADAGFASVVAAVALGAPQGALEPALFVLVALLVWEEESLATLAASVSSDATSRAGLAAARQVAFNLALAGGLVALGTVLARESVSFPPAAATAFGVLFVLSLALLVVLAARPARDETL